MIELTHRCARLYSFRFNPEILTHRGLTYCEDRKSRNHDNPLLAQYNSTWLCEGCPGTIPDCSKEEWEQLKFTGVVGVHGHIHRVMGTQDKRPRVPRPSKAKTLEPVCTKCGAPMQIRCNSNSDRVQLGWCFKCFEKIREKIRTRDKRSTRRIMVGDDGKAVVIMPYRKEHASTERKGGGL